MEVSIILEQLLPWASALGMLVIGFMIMISRVYKKNPFSVGLLVAALLWIWFHAAITNLPTENWKWISFYGQYVALALVPPFWLGTCFSFTGLEKKKAGPILFVLSICALVLIVLTVTSPFTGLFFRAARYNPADGLIFSDPGIFYYVCMVILFTSIPAGVIYLIRNRSGYAAQDWVRVRIILIAVLIPGLAGLADFLFETRSFHFSFSSIAILFSIIILLYGIVGSRLLSSVPFAHKTIIDLMPEAVFVIDERSRIVYTNPPAKVLIPEEYRFARAPLVSVIPEIAGIPGNDSFRNGRVIRINASEYQVNVHHTINRKTGSHTAILVLFDITILARENERLETMVRERTSRLEEEIKRSHSAQSELEDLVRQKEVLLQEVHHRVKNNLQIIMSLMNLQNSRLPPNSEILAACDAMKSRINSISLVHEHLYKTSFYDVIDFGSYMEELAEGLRGLFTDQNITIVTDIQTKGVIVSIDFCVNFGLALTELITNSAKHGLIPLGGGTITAGLRKETDTLHISVKDNGKGFADAARPATGKTLGMELVNTIIKRFRATLETKNENGAVVIITIPGEQ